MPKPKKTTKREAPAAKRTARAKPEPAAGDDVPLADIKAAAAKARASLEYVRKLFPMLDSVRDASAGAPTATLVEGEGDALRAVLKAASQKPQHFATLEDAASQQLLADRLVRHETLADVAADVARLLDGLHASIGRIAERLRAPVREAYDAARPIAQRDAEIRALLAPALAFYGGVAKTKKGSGATNTAAKASRRSITA